MIHWNPGEKQRLYDDQFYHPEYRKFTQLDDRSCCCRYASYCGSAVSQLASSCWSAVSWFFCCCKQAKSPEVEDFKFPYQQSEDDWENDRSYLSDNDEVHIGPEQPPPSFVSTEEGPSRRSYFDEGSILLNSSLKDADWKPDPQGSPPSPESEL